MDEELQALCTPPRKLEGKTSPIVRKADSLRIERKKETLGTVDCDCGNKRRHCEWFDGTLPELKEVIAFWVNYTNGMPPIKKTKFSQTSSAAGPAPK